MAFTGVLASWDLSSAAGSQVSSAAASSAAGVTAGVLTRAPLLTATSGTGSINSSNWATAAQPDPTKYYTFSITPPAGCTLSVSALAIDVLASGTGPASASVGTSVDAFAQNIPVSTATPSTPLLTVNGAHGALELRVFGYSASAATGTMRIENTLSITGALH